MRTVYATALNIKNQSEISAALNYVGKWIQEWYRRQRLSIEVFQSLGEGDLDITPVEGHRLSIRHYATNEAKFEQLVDLSWSYPDQYDKSLGWVIALSLLKQADGLLLSLELAVTGLELMIAPARVKLGSPRVIRDISRLFSISLEGYPYSLTPEFVGAEYVESLVSELKNLTRPYPIVIVSRRMLDDVPLINSNDLAERLAGVAKVYELADKWSSFRLTEEVGKNLSCFGGAVRIYWPRFNDEADPFEHPIWMPWYFKSSDITERTLCELCNMVFDAAAFRHVEPIAISRIRSAAQRQAREVARNSRLKSEDELLDDLIEMEKNLNAAEMLNTELLQENKTLRDNAVAIMAHSSWPYLTPSTSQAQEPAATPEPQVPTCVEDAVRQAEIKSKNIRFLQSAYSSASDSPYKQPERVQEALAALEEVASVWRETIDSGKSGGSVRNLFKVRGFEYADDVSRTSKGKWGDEYIVNYNGKELDISPHITLGAKQPDTCLSIHWAWYKDEKVALVAHVGRHKTNTKT